MPNPTDSESSSQFWESQHQKDEALWLTGSLGPEVWEYLGIEDRIRPGASVLNIGVGLGHCTRALVDRGCQVDVLDIASSALDRVKDVARKGWLVSDLPLLPANCMDLAISNLVAQHMNNRDLLVQLRAVIQSLKPEGVFAMQFAYALDGALNDKEKNPLEAAQTGIFRTLGGMEGLVREAGGQILRAMRIGYFPGPGIGWYGVHIVRADFPFINTAGRVPHGNIALRQLEVPAPSHQPSGTLAAEDTREGFFHEPEWSGSEWVSILLAYVEAFPPREPVVLLLAVDTTREDGPDLEGAKKEVLNILRQTGRPHAPDILVLEAGPALEAFLKRFPQLHRIGSGEGTAALPGERGGRFSAALREISPPGA